MADQQTVNVVALVDDDRLLSLDDRTGLSMLPETESWPDLAEITATTLLSPDATGGQLPDGSVTYFSSG